MIHIRLDRNTSLMEFVMFKKKTLIYLKMYPQYKIKLFMLDINPWNHFTV